MAGIDFQSALNPEQLAAVQAPDGPVLVIAAAGTGKTRTLTYRVAWLVERGVAANRILLLTFTNKAAREMLERADALVGSSVGGLWGGTFHHMANRILRRHADALGYGFDFTILDQDDARSLVRACADELDLLGKHFPKPDVLLSLFSMAANTEVPVEKVARDRFEHYEVRPEDVVRVGESYIRRKRELNAMDFDDLLVNGLRLFRERNDLLEQYQERFLHVLVDEYQDTNKIQAEWVDLVAGRHRNLLVVGDDFQSIYSWRGADFRNILSFPKRYPNTTVFKLETNYRSIPEILDVANACIAGNPEQYQKTIRAVRPRQAKPVLARVRDGDQQAAYVIEQIRRFNRQGYDLKDMIVLYRSHFHAMELQLQLSRERLPYVITSGVRFFEQAHIKDVCAILRLMANPVDELSFLRLLGLLPKVGAKTGARIWSHLERRFNVHDAESRKRVRSSLPAAAKDDWDIIEDLLKDTDLQKKPGDAISRFVDTFYAEYAVETFDNHDRRLEDIGELVNFTARFGSLDEFLSEMALQTNLDAEAENLLETGQDCIRLSTIHQAKGLEWNTVFIL